MANNPETLDEVLKKLYIPIEANKETAKPSSTPENPKIDSNLEKYLNNLIEKKVISVKQSKTKDQEENENLFLGCGCLITILTGLGVGGYLLYNYMMNC